MMDLQMETPPQIKLIKSCPIIRILVRLQKC